MPRTIKRFQCDLNNQIQVFFVETKIVEGETIEFGTWQELVVTEDYQELLSRLQAKVNVDSSDPEPIKPNWAAASSAFFNSPTYQGFRNQTDNQNAWITVENLVVSAAVSGNNLNNDGYLLLQNQWNLMIAGLPAPPKQEQVSELVAIAQANNLQFTYDDTGIMVLI